MIDGKLIPFPLGKSRFPTKAYPLKNFPPILHKIAPISFLFAYNQYESYNSGFPHNQRL